MIWFLAIAWVSVFLFGSETSGRIPLHAERTSPRRTANIINRGIDYI